MTEWTLDFLLLCPPIEEVDLNLVLSCKGLSVNSLLEAQACFISSRVSLLATQSLKVVDSLLHCSRLSMELVLIISWKILMNIKVQSILE